MTTHGTSLCLHEEIMLLALRDREGTFVSGPMYSHAMGGAILAELLMANRITVEDGKENFAAVVSKKPVGDAVIDEALEKMATAKRRAALQTWVQRFARLRQLRHRVARGLCERGILRAEEGTVLLLFKRTVYPEIDPLPERKLIERLRKAVFTETRQVDPRTVVLVSLAHSAGLLRIPFDKKKLKGRKKRIERLVNGEVMGKATREAVQAAQAAVMVACMVPAMVAVTASH